MGKKKDFKYICCNCSGNNNVIFSMNDVAYDFDIHDNCLVWDSITFYGVPTNLSDDKMSKIFDGNYQEAIKIGELTGCLILCKQILAEGDDPWEICDDVNADLEYVISALTEREGPLNIEYGDYEQNVYYIHDFKMESKYNNEELKSKIIKELPVLIFTLFHVYPDIIAYYPSHLEYKPNPNIQARYEVLQNIAAQKVDSAFNLDKDNNMKENTNNIINFGDAYQFDEDELDRLHLIGQIS